MNRKLGVPLLSLAVGAIFLIVSACVNPLGGLSGLTPKTTITVHMKATAPALSGLLQRLSMKALATSKTHGRRAGGFASKGASRSAQSSKAMTGSPKAYLGADTIRFTLLNSASQQVTAWGYGSGANAYTQSVSNGGGYDISLPVPEQSVPAGTYTLRADIYNTQVSTGTPMVTGAASVTVSPNQTTPVVVSCLPVSPQALTIGGGTASAELVPWSLYMGDGSGVNSVGGECWYQVHLDAGTTYMGNVSTDSEPYDAYAVLFDSSGAMVAVGGGTDYYDGMPLVYYAETSGTYYIGVFPFSTSTGASTVETYLTMDIWPPVPELYFDDVYPNGPSGQEVDLEWSGPSSDSGIEFAVRRSTDPTFATYSDVTDNGDLWYNSEYGAWQFYESYAPYGQTLYYKVIADGSAHGGGQASSNVVTAPAPPPSNVEASWANDLVTATWDSVSGATEYYCELWRNGEYYRYCYASTTSVNWGDLPGSQYFHVLVEADVGSGYGYCSLSNEAPAGGGD